MKLTKKILLAVILPFILFMTAGLVVIGIVFTLNFKEQSEKSNINSVHKVTEHLESVENSFKETALSLSLFENTYEIISKEYSEDIVLKHIFHNFKIDLVCFFDSKGECISGKKFNRTTDEYEGYTEDFIASFNGFIQSEHDIGYISFKDDVYIVVKVPYIASKSGYVMLNGRKLDESFYNEINSISQGQASITKYSELSDSDKNNLDDFGEKAILSLNKSLLAEDSLVLQIDFQNIKADAVVVKLFITASIFLVTMILILFILLWFVSKYINRPIKL